MPDRKKHWVSVSVVTSEGGGCCFYISSDDVRPECRLTVGMDTGCVELKPGTTLELIEEQRAGATVTVTEEGRHGR